MSLLTVNKLNIKFYDHDEMEKAVTNVSFALEEGEIMGLVGESGSGKTLTSLVIAGLLNRQDIEKTGEIYFLEKEILNIKRNELRKLQGKDIGIIFQEPMTSLNPVKKIGWQIEESLNIHFSLTKKEKYEKVIRLLQEVELQDAEKVYHSYPHELSGGMRQRVMIASAMVSEPKLLIADEPTTALDVTIQEQIIKLLRKINEKKKTAIIFISHDLGLVQKFCHKICVMKDGEIIEKGKTKELFESPVHEYTKELIGAIPKIEYIEQEIVDSTEVLIQAKAISAGYKKEKKIIDVLYDISFTLRQGEVLGVVGESGSGKSTLAKVILNLISHSGDLLVKEKYPQMVFQDPFQSLNPARRVGWILEEPLKNKTRLSAKERKKKVEEMLKRVGLDSHYKNSFPKELSGGQRQRIGIAHALMLEPKLIIADEALSALDVTMQSRIVTLLKNIQKEMECGIIFISHDLATVQKLCHSIMVIKDGRVVEYGTTNDIYQMPKEKYTKELLKASGFYDREDSYDICN